MDYSSGTVDVSRVKYGYDCASNRIWREDVVAAANSEDHDEFYTYDDLNRLVTFDRGNLTGTFPAYTGIAGTPGEEQDWALDQLGNWSGFVAKTSGTTDLNQTRYHNDVNEIDGNSGNPITETVGTSWADPAYDAAGNMTTMPQPLAPASSYTLTYDAWNRLVEVEDGANTVQENEYNGLGERIVRSVYDSGTLDHRIHYYYNATWQLLEERKEVSGTEDDDPLGQYVWHPYYVDALAVRYWDGNVDGDYDDTDEGAQYFLQDANFNVTAVVDDSGTVLERYAYTAYGKVTYLEDDFDAATNQWSTIGNTHLYTGRERDPETGLQLNRNRYYASHLGRWINRDPIGYSGGDSNLYGYVGGRPGDAVDPHGLSFWDCFGSPREKNGKVCGYSIWLLTGSCCAPPDQVIAATDRHDEFVNCWWDCEVTIHKCAIGCPLDAAGGGAGVGFTHYEYVTGVAKPLANASDVTTLQSRLALLLREHGCKGGLQKALRVGAQEASKRPIRSGIKSGIAGVAIVEAGFSAYCSWKCY